VLLLVHWRLCLVDVEAQLQLLLLLLLLCSLAFADLLLPLLAFVLDYLCCCLCPLCPSGQPLTPNESDAFKDYFYHIVAARGSGEFALRHILAPGAWAHAPLQQRLLQLKVRGEGVGNGCAKGGWGRVLLLME
jgi:hypothetical protein